MAEPKSHWSLQPCVRYLACLLAGLLLLLLHVLPHRSAGGGTWFAHPLVEDRIARPGALVGNTLLFPMPNDVQQPLADHDVQKGDGAEVPVVHARGAIPEPETPGRFEKGLLAPTPTKRSPPEPTQRPPQATGAGAAAKNATTTVQTDVTEKAENAERTEVTEKKVYQPHLWSKSSPLLTPPRVVSPCDQRVRQARANEKCALYRQAGLPIADVAKLNESRTYRFMLVDKRHKTVYCEVPKAACTSWKTFLANITGKVEANDRSRLFQLVHDTTYHPKIGFRFLDSYTPAERRYILRTYFKFLVVRNPYTRFLSAYENKFRGASVQSDWYHANMGKYILNKYRNNGGKGGECNNSGEDVTFSELAQMIANPNERHPQRFDAHFWKQHGDCFPCLVDYDYIAKVETMAHDAEAIISTIVPNVDVQLLFLNKNENTVHERDYVHKAYQNISDSLLTSLSAVYDMDMDVFGYEFDGERTINCNSAADGQPQCC